jgi:uncharacterized protein
MDPEPTPTATAERIFTLDVVRGAALLGILIMNLPGFSSSYFIGANGVQRWTAWWQVLVEALRDVLCSGKFNSLFSMLFAVGFTLQLQRLEQRNPQHALAIYCRRLFWLLVFGVVHACVFWTGDVLHNYALLGLLLLLLRRLSDRTLLVLIAASLLYAPAVELVQMYTTTWEEAYALNAFYRSWENSNDLAYGRGSFLDAAREHTREMFSAYTEPHNLLFNFGFYVQLFTTMLIGLLLGRRQIFQNAHAWLPQLRLVQYAGLALGLATGLVDISIDEPPLPTPDSVRAEACYVVSRVSLMACYVATLLRLCHAIRWQGVLQRIALVGRMPLTNYLLQTLLCTFLFYGWGLGWWNQVDPLTNIGLALLIYVMQMPLSAWWLKTHELGPMEYLWRRLTYGRAMRRTAVADNPG